MADGKIYITISDNRDGETNDNSTIKTKEKDKNSALGEYALHEFMHLIKENATEVVNYSISNIGYYTGNYQAQRDIETAIGVGNSIIGLGASFYAGVKISGMVAGGLVGLGVAGVGMAVSKGLEIKRNIEDNRRQNIRVDRLRDISGLNSLTNGSR